jgi:hypothetical protein
MTFDELFTDFVRHIETNFPELHGEEFRVTRYWLARSLAERAMEFLT